MVYLHLKFTGNPGMRSVHMHHDAVYHDMTSSLAERWRWKCRVPVFRLLRIAIEHGTAGSPDTMSGRLLGGGLSALPGRVRAANPLTYATPAAPPFLIVHGSKDRLVPLSRRTSCEMASPPPAHVWRR